MRDSLDRVPLDTLLLETDAPRLSPQVVRGTTNYPANVAYLYEYVAHQKGINESMVCDAIQKNLKAII